MKSRSTALPVLASIIAAAVLSVALPVAFAALTFTGTSVSGDGNVAIDGSGTIAVGTSSATGITIGKSGITTTFPGAVGVAGNVTAAKYYGDGSSLTGVGTASVGCQTASSLGFALNGTDETAKLQSVLNTFYAAGGGCLYIDNGKTLRVDGQIVMPYASSSPWTMPPIRITGNSSGIGSADALPSVPPAGSTLDLRYAGNRIVSLGQGTLEIDHLTIVNRGTSCGTFMYSTLTNMRIHDDSFFGAYGGASACDDVWVAGAAVANATIQGNASDYFQGYASAIRDNFADQIRTLVRGQAAFNSIPIVNNTIWTRSGRGPTNDAAIEIEGGTMGGSIFYNANNYIAGNLIEMLGYNNAIYLSNTAANTLIGNSFWDNSSAYAYCSGSGAGSNMVFGSGSFCPGWNPSGGIQLTGATDTIDQKVLFTAVPQFRYGLYFGIDTTRALSSAAGNSSVLAAASGTLASGDLVSIDANGNFVDSGLLASSIGGGVSTGTAGQLAYYAAGGTTVSGVTGLAHGIVIAEGSGAPTTTVGAADTVLLGNGASLDPAFTSIPSCPDSGGNHLNYSTTTHTFACGTTGGTVGSVGFSGITGGTNTSAAMVVGSGASLAPSGSGTVSANQVNGAVLPTSTGVLGTNASGQLVAGTVSTLIDNQGPQSAVTATGGDQQVYATTLSSGIPAGKCIRVTAAWTNASTSGSVYDVLRFGGSGYMYLNTLANNGTYVGSALICNNPGVQNAQQAISLGTGMGGQYFNYGVNAASENTASSIVVKLTLNSGAGSTFTPLSWLVESVN